MKTVGLLTTALQDVRAGARNMEDAWYILLLLAGVTKLCAQRPKVRDLKESLIT